jgi:hypothetical protein
MAKQKELPRAAFSNGAARVGLCSYAARFGKPDTSGNSL